MEYRSGAPVALSPVRAYDEELIFSALNEQARMLGIAETQYAGKRVVIKPNLVAPSRPDAAATTHPVFLRALVRFLRSHGAEQLLLAESPGGPFTEASLRNNYKVCGILEAAQECGLPLNFDTTSGIVNAPDAYVCRSFSVITPIREADVIVDLCKLKSHSLTRMSCAVKNFFGVIPGIEKFAMHSAYPQLDAFSEMIVDLAAMLCGTHEILTVCDAIVTMEGNGPTGGRPRPLGAVLMSASPFCLDAAAEELIGFSGTVSITKCAAKRGLCPASAEELTVLGASLADFRVSDFREPDASSGKFLRSLPELFGGRFAAFFSPRPEIDGKRCVGCGVCAASCPQKTVTIVNRSGKKRARIETKKCIRCFCCQELCPIHAVKIRKNPLIALLH